MTYSISDLAKEFGVSSRTIRFYEEKGLLSPRRTSGNQRSYSRKDRAKLKLILRGKHLGWKLDEMESIISLTDVDPDRVGQMNKAVEIGLRHLDQVNDQIDQLMALKAELLSYGDTIIDRLQSLDKSKPQWEERLKQERQSLEELYEKVAKPSRSKQ